MNFLFLNNFDYVIFLLSDLTNIFSSNSLVFILCSVSLVGLVLFDFLHFSGNIPKKAFGAFVTGASVILGKATGEVIVDAVKKPKSSEGNTTTSGGKTTTGGGQTTAGGGQCIPNAGQATPDTYDVGCDSGDKYASNGSGEGKC